MNEAPASIERVQKCVVNSKLCHFLKKNSNLPHSILPIQGAS